MFQIANLSEIISTKVNVFQTVKLNENIMEKSCFFICEFKIKHLPLHPLLKRQQHGGLAQLARAPALHAGGQRFESVILHVMD